jgi:hypothetical protein
MVWRVGANPEYGDAVLDREFEGFYGPAFAGGVVAVPDDDEDVGLVQDDAAGGSVGFASIRAVAIELEFDFGFGV